MKRLVLGIFLSLFIFGCAGLQPTIPKPKVSINSFKAIPSNSIMPHFEIDLRVINTSREELNIQGIVYTIELQGNEILTGVAKDLSPIKSYSEENIKISGSPDLFGSFGLIKDMMNKPEDNLEYEITVSIDAGDSHPILHTTKTGNFSFSDSLQK